MPGTTSSEPESHRSRAPHHHRDDDRHRRHRESHSSKSHRSSHREHRSSRAQSRSLSPEASSKRHHRHSSHSPGRRRDHDRERRRHHRHRSRSRSGSPDSSRRRHRHRSASPGEVRRSRKPLPSQIEAFTKTPQGGEGAETPVADKEKPNYGNTGKLAAETNTVTAKDGSTIVLKYHEPPEARKPPAKDDWRLFIFKGPDLLETIQLGGQTCWLIGKEMSVVDLPIEHPSCSKQHAAIQFRHVEKRNEFGDRIGRVKPYMIDLESSNGTTVNGSPAPPGRYMELRDKDVITFGNSSREYVLMLSPSS